MVNKRRLDRCKKYLLDRDLYQKQLKLSLLKSLLGPFTFKGPLILFFRLLFGHHTLRSGEYKGANFRLLYFRLFLTPSIAIWCPLNWLSKWPLKKTAFYPWANILRLTDTSAPLLSYFPCSQNK